MTPLPDIIDAFQKAQECAPDAWVDRRGVAWRLAPARQFRADLAGCVLVELDKSGKTQPHWMFTLPA